jgi:hypothetical protein
MSIIGHLWKDSYETPIISSTEPRLESYKISVQYFSFLRTASIVKEKGFATFRKHTAIIRKDLTRSNIYPMFKGFLQCLKTYP